MIHEYYAHSLPGRPKEEWQRLENHLKNVAELAKGFAEEFGAGERVCISRLCWGVPAIQGWWR
ncbi:MAG: hypothetical protein NT010_15300 [Proteobacteria bacterium]|nr:hypothetical protein [Pseudomonadota bacterium]